MRIQLKFNAIEKWILYGLSAMLFVVVWAWGLATDANGPIVWVLPNWERVAQTAAAGTATHLDLYAARGEFEPFQIAIQAPAGGLKQVNVAVSDLIGPNGDRIGNTHLPLYREHYVYVPHASPHLNGAIDRSLGKGWYADGLIPFVDPETGTDLVGAELDAVPFDLAAQQNQPIWVDLFVPRTAKAGDYTGQFTVTSDRGSAMGTIRLHVWDFELPQHPSLLSEFDIGQATGRDQTALELLQHKLMPQVSAVNPSHVEELSDRWGWRSLRLPLWSGANNRTCQIDPPPAVEDIRTLAARYPAHLFRYARYADETDNCPDLLTPIAAWADAIHQAGVKTALAATPIPELESAIDLWIVLPNTYETAGDRIQTLQSQNQPIWFYLALVQDKYSPRWLLDYPPIHYRIAPGFIAQSLGLTGMLYWQVDYWTNDPWHDVAYVDGDRVYPGEGVLVYPGQVVGIKGVVPSMRLKWIREGVEDYEYIKFLKKSRGSEVTKITQEVALDWQHWTRDSQVLETARRAIGALITEKKI
jgi:Domain of unknown function (DUF4091)